MGRIVVTGSAGALGRRVVALLAADGSEVVGLDRRGAPGIAGGGATVDLAADGAGADEALDAALQGAEGLVHLAWLTPDGRDERAVAAAAAVNHRIAARVLAAAGRSGVATLVHLSSATVYGAWPDNPVPLTEREPLRPNASFSFAVEKADAERMVAEFAGDHPSVAVAVLRPAATVGAPEHPLYRALAGTAGPRAGEPARRVQVLHVDDLAEAVRHALRLRLSGAYNVAADTGVPEDTARALAGGQARVALPVPLAVRVWSLEWALWGLGVPSGARPYALHSWVVASDRLLATGWAPRWSSEEALVATDRRVHWDDLPPARRQGVTLLAATGVVAAGSLVAASVVAAIGLRGVSWRQRPRRWRRGGGRRRGSRSEPACPESPAPGR